MEGSGDSSGIHSWGFVFFKVSPLCIDGSVHITDEERLPILTEESDEDDIHLTNTARSILGPEIDTEQFTQDQSVKLIVAWFLIDSICLGQHLTLLLAYVFVVV